MRTCVWWEKGWELGEGETVGRRDGGRGVSKREAEGMKEDEREGERLYEKW